MKYFTKILFICLALNICSTNIHAQISLLQNAINKIESSKNFSYQELFINKNPAGNDTTIWQIKSSFVKMPEDKNFGYFYTTGTADSITHIVVTETYNGQDIISLNFNDSTYQIFQPGKHELESTLIGLIQRTKNILKNYSSKMTQERDTIINSITCAHFNANIKDTIINNEHYYITTQWFVDKLSNNILAIIQKNRNYYEGIGLINDYTEYFYSDYQFNQDNTDALFSVTIPEYFRPYKKLSTLQSGTIAPDWTLYSTDGKKLSLSEMKGKVVLIDFSFIGCVPCLEAIPIMNKLHEKYIGKNVAIISLYFRDNNKAVKKFIQDYNIKYPLYANAAKVAEQYGVGGAPTFYFIDKNGIINKVLPSLSDDFEEQAISIIEQQLNK